MSPARSLRCSSPNVYANVDDDDDFQQPLPMPAVGRLHSSSSKVESNVDEDDDFQPPLPMPAVRPLRSSTRSNQGGSFTKRRRLLRDEMGTQDKP
ncbi:unnamed protein product [Mucor fragilis]